MNEAQVSFLSLVIRSDNNSACQPNQLHISVCIHGPCALTLRKDTHTYMLSGSDSHQIIHVVALHNQPRPFWRLVLHVSLYRAAGTHPFDGMQHDVLAATQ